MVNYTVWSLSCMLTVNYSVDFEVYANGILHMVVLEQYANGKLHCVVLELFAKW